MDLMLDWMNDLIVSLQFHAASPGDISTWPRIEFVGEVLRFLKYMTLCASPSSHSLRGKRRWGCGGGGGHTLGIDVTSFSFMNINLTSLFKLLMHRATANQSDWVKSSSIARKVPVKRSHFPKDFVALWEQLSMKRFEILTFVKRWS